MIWLKRIFLFGATNIAVIFVLSVVFGVLGIDQYLASEHGIPMVPLLVFAALFGMGGAFISLAISKWMAKRATGAEVIEQPRNDQEAWLLRVVDDMARRAGVGRPEVAVYDAPDMNAFATGMSRDNALVAVTTGLLNGMSADQAVAVLGHEISHVANGDMVTMTLLQGVLNTVVIFLSRVIGFVVDKAVFRNERGIGIGYFITVIVAQIVLGILASMIVNAFSRWREYRADAGGASLKSRSAMIGALQRLKSGREASDLPEQIEALGISGKMSGGLKRLFMSHPPLDERIAALERVAG